MAKKTTVTFSLDISADSDILRWLGEQKNRSAAIRDALRAYMGRQDITLGDVYWAVQELDRKLDGGLVVASAAGGGSRRGDAGEPPEVAANLAKLVDGWKT